MTQQIAIATFLALTIFPGNARPQEEHTTRRCETAPAADTVAPVQAPAKVMRIERLIFVGQPELAKPLQDQIASSLARLPVDDNKEGLNQLLKHITAAWQHQGYFKAKVEASGTQVLRENDEGRTVAITVRVDAGRQYRLDEIQFRVSPSGATSTGANSPTAQFTDTQLRAFFQIRHEEIFDPEIIQGGITQLRHAYAVRGYINFVLVPSSNFDDTNGSIMLFLEIEEGRQFHFGNIEVLGADKELAGNLLGKSGIAPGDVFDPAHFAELWKQSELVLPKDMELEDIERHVNADLGTVDLTLRLVRCPVP